MILIRIWVKTLLAFTLIFSLNSIWGSHITFSFGPSLLKQGMVGDDIYELQSRLSYLGYYKGSIDGIYGSQTKAAVRDFQSRFGMKVDGVAGSKTKDMLVRATPKWDPKTMKKVSSNPKFSDNDIKLMAMTVHGEARGEPYIGQVAVAAVILNRLESPDFPHSISSIIFQPRAFTAVDDGQIWLTPNETSFVAVRDAINGWDPTGEALYYFNPDTATSKWIWTRPQIKKIGQHIFAR